MEHLRELTKNPEQLFHMEIDRTDFEFKDNILHLK